MEEEESGPQLLPRASPTVVCKPTESSSQLRLAPGVGSAQDSCFGWRLPKAAGEDERGATKGEEALTPQICMIFRGHPGNP